MDGDGGGGGGGDGGGGGGLRFVPVDRHDSRLESRLWALDLDSGWGCALLRVLDHAVESCSRLLIVNQGWAESWTKIKHDWPEEDVTDVILSLFLHLSAL